MQLTTQSITKLLNWWNNFILLNEIDELAQPNTIGNKPFVFLVVYSLFTFEWTYKRLREGGRKFIEYEKVKTKGGGGITLPTAEQRAWLPNWRSAKRPFAAVATVQIPHSELLPLLVAPLLPRCLWRNTTDGWLEKKMIRRWKNAYCIDENCYSSIYDIEFN